METFSNFLLTLPCLYSSPLVVFPSFSAFLTTPPSSPPFPSASTSLLPPPSPPPTHSEVHLFGPTYNADGAWERSRWDREMPHEAYFDWKKDGGGGGCSGGASGSGRGREVVHLSDSEEDGEDGEDGGWEESRGRRRGDEEERDEEEDEEEGDDDEEEEEDEEDDDGRGPRQLPWWQQKWPKAMLRDPETRWQMADHCRSRTQLYHTLLHYKLRLFLKVKGEKRTSSHIAHEWSFSITRHASFDHCVLPGCHLSPFITYHASSPTTSHSSSLLITHYLPLVTCHTSLRITGQRQTARVRQKVPCTGRQWQ